MMGGHHAATGAAAWVAVTSSAPFAFGWYPDVTNVGVMVGSLVCAGAALLPDSDHHNGTIAESLPPVSNGISKIVADVSGGHRHGTHSVIGVVFFTAVAWGLSFLTLHTKTFGDVLIGPGILCVLLVAFAMDALKLQHHVVWAWVSAVGLAALIAIYAPEEWYWLPFSVGLGSVVHLLGDFVTTMGIPIFWPLKPKPPKFLRSRGWKWLPFDNMWTTAGNFALPILGDAGSKREWAVLIPVSAYAILGFLWSLLAQMGADPMVMWNGVGHFFAGLV